MASNALSGKAAGKAMAGVGGNVASALTRWQWQYAKPGSYTTQLSPADEQSFQQWVAQNKVPWQDSPTADYDMRGYYKALVSGDPTARQSLNSNDGLMHFPDTWKTPYHSSFSNESMYATPDAPRWINDSQLADKNGRVLFDETAKK
jgi:hypothetical protein